MQVPNEIQIQSLVELKQFAEHLLPALANKQILLLNGPLGVGKTQLVKFLVEACGGGDVCSPTFVIHNRYVTPAYSIDHIDLYRLQSEDELESTGFWDLFSQSRGLIVVEWAENLPSAWIPTQWSVLELDLDFVSENSAIRRVSVRRA